MTTPNHNNPNGSNVRTLALRNEALPADEQLLVEWNLLRILGLYFCLDNKKAATIREPLKFTQVVANLPDESKHFVQIVPNQNYGYPSIGALRVFFALIRKYLEHGYPIPRTIQFSQREIHRLIGSRSGGFQDKQLAEYLLQLRWTAIEAWRYEKETDQWFFRPFSLLSDMYLSGKKNRINQCAIKLDEDIYRNINDCYGLRILYHRLDPLSPTGKILYLKLFNGFSTVYRKTQRRAGLTYHKDYAALIADWLPHFKVLMHLAKIRQEQLGKHLDDLTTSGLLAQWDIRKNSKETGFTLIFQAGDTFFTDYNRLQNNHVQLRLMPEDAGAGPSAQEQEKNLLAYYFAKLYHGDTEAVLDVFTENDRHFAAQLLRQMTLAEAKDFVDYALDEQAPKTDYHPIVFKGIEQYLIGYIHAKAQRQEEQQRRQSQQRAESEARRREAYDQFWRETVAKLRESMPAEVLGRLEQDAEHEVRGEGIHYLMVKTMVRIRTNEKIAREYHLPAFADWTKAAAKGRPYTADQFLPKTS